ncbi:NUDIX hydrolase [Corynebacterium sp.]|uniref:NUDIX domain-containing protein n=1 Tax=Corynebacterium sp. TaxID=1720 RepID=UPI0025BCDA58|nr:NUDIX hydrolase [Corynebacterium sp.]
MTQQALHGDGWAVGLDGARRWGTLGAAGLFLTTRERGTTLLLVQHRASWTNFGGTWGIPGGAVEPGESAVDAALRETQEETGVDPADVRVADHLVTARAELSHVLVRVPLAPEDMDLAAPVTEAVERGSSLLEAVRAHRVTHPETGYPLTVTMGGQLCWETPDDTVGEWTYTTVLGTCDDPLELFPSAESADLAWCPLDEVAELPLIPPFREALPDLSERIEGQSQD